MKAYMSKWIKFREELAFIKTEVINIWNKGFIKWTLIRISWLDTGKNEIKKFKDKSITDEAKTEAQIRKVKNIHWADHYQTVG